MKLRLYYPDTPPLPLPQGHRFPAEKYTALRDHLIADEARFGPRRLARSPLATVEDLTAVHDAGYVRDIFDGTLAAKARRRIGIPLSNILLQRSRATVGGTLAAAATALQDGMSGQLAGGTHHAHRDFGSGYCVFNDCAVAAYHLRKRHSGLRLAILDLDVHQGDGNAALMAGDRDPLTWVVSVHGDNNFPFRKVASDLDIPLPDHAADTAFLAAVATALDTVIAFRPDLVFYISGVDPLITDRLGRLDVSMAGLRAREALVLGEMKRSGIATAIVIGGGYAEPISHTIEAYRQTFDVAHELFG